jgi:hypothetical protein
MGRRATRATDGTDDSYSRIKSVCYTVDSSTYRFNMADTNVVDLTVLAAMQRHLIVTTLAAAIIQSRGAKTVTEIKEALRDAGHIISPQRGSAMYEQWAKDHGIATTAAVAAE